MTLLVYAVDLGTTNIKVVLYDESLRCLAVESAPMVYERDAERVEFDAAVVFDTVIDLIRRCAPQPANPTSRAAVIAVTGQAESLVLTDAAGQPVVPGISWMDERSVAEAEEMAERFGVEAAFAITGEPEPTATWPATKLRGLHRHRPDVLERTSHVLMIKDYVLMRLVGRAVGEETTRGFTYLYDVAGRRYWPEMVDFCGITTAQLPEIVAAGTDLGPVSSEVAELLPAGSSFTVNAGALDHFCGMVGADAYRPGEVSASAGTVLALSLLAPGWTFDPEMKISFHAGLRPGEIVLFTCADSGGLALDWFQSEIVGGGYEGLEHELPLRRLGDAPLFLPYLTGVNPPDFNDAARGAFVGLRLRHDRVDLALSVMEGVAHLLRRNLDDFADHGYAAASISSAGGGTASAFWNQLKADVTGLELRTPDEREVACRGAAILALAAAGVIDSIDDTRGLHRPEVRTYTPRRSTVATDRYTAFSTTLQRLYGVETNDRK